MLSQNPFDNIDKGKYILNLTLEIRQVGGLVEAGRLETEGVDDVVDLLGGVLETLVSLLGRGVGTSVCENPSALNFSSHRKYSGIEL